MQNCRSVRQQLIGWTREFSTIPVPRTELRRDSNEHARELTKVIVSFVLRLQSTFVSPRVSEKKVTGGARGGQTQEPR